MVGILNWLFDLISSGSKAVGVITQPFIDIGDGNVYTMLSLLTIGGLSAYLVVALVKWLVS